MPAKLSEQLPALIADAEQAITPHDERAFAVAMDTLFDWAETFDAVKLATDEQRRENQITNIVAAYREPLADVPADLLVTAVKRACAQHRYRNLPMPGDIRALIADDLARRKTVLLRLKTAEMKLRMDREAAARRSADAGPTKRVTVPALKVVPREKDDTARPVDRAEAIRRVAEETKSFRRIAKPWERKQ